ncbi:MAG: DUF5659 domain-containing protein [Candidatus Levybacteria bacterium]|nr:DUF5659 domain-containing protein [Candidatus Levybacteria bacterium]
MENLKEYQSNDFYQSVVLKTAGLPLLRLEKSSGRFFIFVFDDPENKAQEIITKYWNNDLKVDAKEFVENINQFKARIHSGI